MNSTSKDKYLIGMRKFFCFLMDMSCVCAPCHLCSNTSCLSKHVRRGRDHRSGVWQWLRSGEGRLCRGWRSQGCVSLHCGPTPPSGETTTFIYVIWGLVLFLIQSVKHLLSHSTYALTFMTCKSDTLLASILASNVNKQTSQLILKKECECYRMWIKYRIESYTECVDCDWKLTLWSLSLGCHGRYGSERQLCRRRGPEQERHPHPQIPHWAWHHHKLGWHGEGRPYNYSLLRSNVRARKSIVYCQ